MHRTGGSGTSGGRGARESVVVASAEETPTTVASWRGPWYGAAVWFGLPLALCPLVAAVRPGDAAVAVERGRALLGFERALGVDVEASIHSWFSERPVLWAVATVFYFAAHLGAVIATACWLAAFHHRRFVEFGRTFAAAQVLTALAYLAVPVAPLRMLMSDHTASVDADWTRSVQYEFAAMPSGHVVFALVVAQAVWRHAAPSWRWVGIAHLLCTVVAVVATAHHLLVDAAVAVVVVGVAVALVRLGARIDAMSGGSRPLTARRSTATT